MMPEPLVHVVREAAGEPEGALILLHGRGADEHDLTSVLDILDPERRLVGLTPGAPLPGPGGGRWWYAVPRVGYPDPNTFHATYARLTSFLDGWLQERDPVISVQLARDARERLEAGGLDVDYHEHQGGHHLDPDTLALLTRWAGEHCASFTR